MVRRCLAVAVVLVAPVLFAQNQSGSANQTEPTTSQTPPQVNVAVPATPVINVVTGGLYGTAIAPVPYVPLAPTQNVPTPPQPGTAGISLNAPTTYNSPGYSYVTPLYAGNPASPYSNSVAQPAPVEQGRLINDLGPSIYVDGDSSRAAAAAPSLGEVAAQYRSRHSVSAHVYTNADAERLHNTVSISGVPVTRNVAPQGQDEPSPNTQPQGSQPPR